MDKPTTVFIADSTEEFCNLLTNTLHQSQGFQVIGTANDGETALSRIQQLRPQVLVLDLMLAKRDGISILKSLAASDCKPVTLVTSGFVTEFVAATAANLGAKYLMLKPCDLSALLERIGNAMREFSDFESWRTMYRQYYERLDMAPYPHRFYATRTFTW